MPQQDPKKDPKKDPKMASKAAPVAKKPEPTKAEATKAKPGMPPKR